MSAVEGQGAGAVQEVHALGEPPALGLDDQVLVGRHQTEGAAAPAAALDFGGEQTQEEPTLVVVQKDRCPRDSPRDDVVDACRRMLVARSASPGRR
jgi:hypothetical protein